MRHSYPRHSTPVLTSSNKSVFVYGPQGCGKTLNAPAIARHFGLQMWIDADDLAGRKPPLTNHLVLCVQDPRETGLVPADARHVLTFAEACRRVGIKDPLAAARSRP